MNRDLAMFDFDGTITKRDTLSAFILHTKGPVRFLLGMLLLSPSMILYKLKILSRKKAKEQIFSHFFKGMKETEFQAFCKDFSTNRIGWMLREKAMARIRKHWLKGHRIVIVSASPENWVKEWATAHGLEYIATQLEVVDERLTGKIIGENCQGIEKVHRVKAYLQLEDFKQIHTYGDSRGDWPFLHLGTYKNFKPFREEACFHPLVSL